MKEQFMREQFILRDFDRYGSGLYYMATRYGNGFKKVGGSFPAFYWSMSGTNFVRA